MKSSKRISKMFASAVMAVFVVYAYKCPFKLFFGIDCPGCGMTRAFLNFLKGNFGKALEYHPLFPVFGIITVYEIYIYIFPDKKRLSKKAELIITISSFSLLIFIWLIKIKNQLGGCIWQIM